MLQFLDPVVPVGTSSAQIGCQPILAVLVEVREAGIEVTGVLRLCPLGLVQKLNLDPNAWPPTIDFEEVIDAAGDLIITSIVPMVALDLLKHDLKFPMFHARAMAPNVVDPFA